CQRSTWTLVPDWLIKRYSMVPSPEFPALGDKAISRPAQWTAAEPSIPTANTAKPAKSLCMSNLDDEWPPLPRERAPRAWRRASVCLIGSLYKFGDHGNPAKRPTSSPAQGFRPDCAVAESAQPGFVSGAAPAPVPGFVGDAVRVVARIGQAKAKGRCLRLQPGKRRRLLELFLQRRVSRRGDVDDAPAMMF